MKSDAGEKKKPGRGGIGGGKFCGTENPFLNKKKNKLNLAWRG